MPIRFEIKPEVVKWVSVNCDLPAALAAELIRQLMGEMIVHDCISVTPAPDAALLEALRMVRRSATPDDIFYLSTEEIAQIDAALASVEQGGE